MSIINRELQRGLEISEKIMVGKRPWSDLFIKHTFFTSDYKYYISVTSASKVKEAHKIWSGYVESKIRMLVQKLEQHQSIALAQAFNKGYERRHRCKDDNEIAQVQEGSLDFLAPEGSVDVKADEGGQVGPLSEAEPKEDSQDDCQVKDDGVENGHDIAGTKTEVPENSNIPENPTPATVYTTTHYIGVQLDPRMCPPALNNRAAYATATRNAFVDRLKN